MSALKPCPFCGGEAKLYPPTYAEDNPSEIVGPACVNCHDCCAAIVGTWEDDAIEAWNRRDAAHLIADAPEMLAALKALINSPAIADEDHNDPVWGDGETAQAKLLAHAAIAKAEGRQP